MIASVPIEQARHGHNVVICNKDNVLRCELEPLDPGQGQSDILWQLSDYHPRIIQQVPEPLAVSNVRTVQDDHYLVWFLI